MKKAMTKTMLKKSVSEFGQHLKLGTDHIKKACEIYADAVANDHTAAYEFERAYPYITQSTWDKMRLVGVGAIESKVLILSDRLGSKLMHLPINEQRKVLKDKVSVLKNGVVFKKDIVDLSKSEEAQVFDDKGKKRTVTQQKNLIKAKSTKAKVVPYEVIGSMLIVRRKCSISLKELKSIIKAMS